jgi:D-sedoheptulose 7-phosphate isomerase
VTVFTNGVFDLLHAGHVAMLTRARALGDRLIVGLNTDASARVLKGPGRPVVPEVERRALLEALRVVDEVVMFDELTPERLVAAVRPEVLVKGADWQLTHIVGADLVKAWGGRVETIELIPDLSTTVLIERIRAAPFAQRATQSDAQLLGASADLLQQVARSCEHDMARGCDVILRCLQEGGKILICGNGGSAAQAQHFAAELVVRFVQPRRALAALALAADASVLTAAANDLGAEFLFARQVEALAKPGDVVLLMSTSGSSPNILEAAHAAQRARCVTLALTGATGALAALADVSVRIPSTSTALIQQAHAAVVHAWSVRIETWAQSRRVDAAEPG